MTIDNYFDSYSMLKLPAQLLDLQRETAHAGFTMASEPLTGALLRTLAASKIGGNFLEIGTGTGMGTCWILDGMDAQSNLTSIERDPQVSKIAQRYLSYDPRVQFVVEDAEPFLKTLGAQQFDFIFADTFPGKFYLLGEALNSLRLGGLYIIDDLLSQANWPEGHQTNVDRLVHELGDHPDLRSVRLEWASGLLIATRVRV